MPTLNIRVFTLSWGSLTSLNKACSEKNLSPGKECNSIGCVWFEILFILAKLESPRMSVFVSVAGMCQLGLTLGCLVMWCPDMAGMCGGFLCLGGGSGGYSVCDKMLSGVNRLWVGSVGVRMAVVWVGCCGGNCES